MGHVVGMIEQVWSKCSLKGIPEVSLLTTEMTVWSIFMRKIYLNWKEDQFVKLSGMYNNFMLGNMYESMLIYGENTAFYCHLLN